ncbi:MAG: M48 family metallopeptidase [Maritimibacter sp.]
MSDFPTYEGFGDYLDGEKAAQRRVHLMLMPDRLRITLADGEVIDWLADELRALPDQADASSLMLMRAGDALARLKVTDSEIARLIRTNAKTLRKRPPVENPGKIVKWAVGAVSSVALIIFVLVPMMANQLALYLPPEGEKALGDATFEQIRTALSEDSFLPISACDGAEGLAALEKMTARLNTDDDLPYPVEISVLDHELVNAFALPGGRIVLFRGLLLDAEAPEEVAAVLAHEIGHVVHRDPTRDALRVAGSVGVLGLLFGDFAGGTVVLMLANQLINAQYSQTAESGADDYAYERMSEAGLPPAAMASFFERLREEYGDEAGLVAHFSSHPQMTARIEAALAAQDQVGAVGEPVLSGEEWQALQSICGDVSEGDTESGADDDTVTPAGTSEADDADLPEPDYKTPSLGLDRAEPDPDRNSGTGRLGR